MEHAHLNCRPPKLMRQNMQRSGFDESKLEKILKKYDYGLRDILLLLVKIDGNFYLQPKSGKYISGNVDDIEDIEGEENKNKSK